MPGLPRQWLKAEVAQAGTGRCHCLLGFCIRAAKPVAESRTSTGKDRHLLWGFACGLPVQVGVKKDGAGWCFLSPFLSKGETAIHLGIDSLLHLLVSTGSCADCTTLATAVTTCCICPFLQSVLPADCEKAVPPQDSTVPAFHYSKVTFISTTATPWNVLLERCLLLHLSITVWPSAFQCATPWNLEDWRAHLI